MSVTTERIRGRAPARHKGPKRFEPGRVCVQPDCDTKLTSYNRHDVCFRHAPLRYPKPRGRAA